MRIFTCILLISIKYTIISVWVLSSTRSTMTFTLSCRWQNNTTLKKHKTPAGISASLLSIFRVPVVKLLEEVCTGLSSSNLNRNICYTMQFSSPVDGSQLPWRKHQAGAETMSWWLWPWCRRCLWSRCPKTSANNLLKTSVMNKEKIKDHKKKILNLKGIINYLFVSLENNVVAYESATQRNNWGDSSAFDILKTYKTRVLPCQTSPRVFLKSHLESF